MPPLPGAHTGAGAGQSHTNARYQRIVKEPFFKECIPSRLEAMSGVIAGAVQALQREGWVNAQNAPCMKLCLEEALANAIRHGNRNDPARTVCLEVYREGDTCTICVYDEGRGFRPDAVPEPEVEQLGGRGVCLLRHYMDSVTYDQGNQCLRMRFRSLAVRDSNGA